MTGALNFANGTWNAVGDDCCIGDCNVSEHLGLKSSTGDNPGISFFDSSNNNLGYFFIDDNKCFTINGSGIRSNACYIETGTFNAIHVSSLFGPIIQEAYTYNNAYIVSTISANNIHVDLPSGRNHTNTLIVGIKLAGHPKSTWNSALLSISDWYWDSAISNRVIIEFASLSGQEFIMKAAVTFLCLS